MITYDYKIIRSGFEVETYKYLDKKMFRGFKRSTRRDPYKITNKEFEELVDIWGDESEKELLIKKKNIIADSSLSRTRTKIRRLINSNIQLNNLLTLTFAKSTTDLYKANKLFDIALKRVCRYYQDFEYLAVPEFQKDVDYYGNKKEFGGSVHYHLLCNLKIKSNMASYDRHAWENRFAHKFWKNGFVNIEETYNIENMGGYLCKYLGKEMFNEKMFGRKKFFRSQSLTSPIEYLNDDAHIFFNNRQSELKMKYSKIFFTDYTGNVEYSSYLLPLDLSK